MILGRQAVDQRVPRKVQVVLIEDAAAGLTTEFPDRARLRGTRHERSLRLGGHAQIRCPVNQDQKINQATDATTRQGFTGSCPIHERNAPERVGCRLVDTACASIAAKLATVAPNQTAQRLVDSGISEDFPMVSSS